MFSVGCKLYLGGVRCLVKSVTNEAFTPKPHHERKDLLRNSESSVGHNGKRQTGNMRGKHTWEERFQNRLHYYIFSIFKNLFTSVVGKTLL